MNLFSIKLVTSRDFNQATVLMRGGWEIVDAAVSPDNYAILTLAFG